MIDSSNPFLYAADRNHFLKSEQTECLFAKLDTSKNCKHDTRKLVVGECSLVGFHFVPSLKLNVSSLAGFIIGG